MPARLRSIPRLSTHFRDGVSLPVHPPFFLLLLHRRRDVSGPPIATITRVNTAAFEKASRASRSLAEVDWSKAFAAAAAGGQARAAGDGAVGESVAIGEIGAGAGNVAVPLPEFVGLADAGLNGRTAWGPVADFGVGTAAQAAADSVVAFAIGGALVGEGFAR